jgi:putative transposase
MDAGGRATQEQLPSIWTLPPGDDDFSNRWKCIKIRFVQKLHRTERRSNVRIAKGERGIWQRRCWEHVIRDEIDYMRHVDYIHWNLMKHGLIERVTDLPKGIKAVFQLSSLCERRNLSKRLGG